VKDLQNALSPEFFDQIMRIFDIHIATVPGFSGRKQAERRQSRSRNGDLGGARACLMS
jgi:hypothetical protein